jgi:hypothetical protein
LRRLTLLRGGRFGLLALLLTPRELIRARLRRAFRFNRRRRRRDRLGLRRGVLRALHRACVHHGGLDRERRRRMGRLTKQHPPIHQGADERRVQQQRQPYRYPAVTRALHRSCASTPRTRHRRRLGDEADLARAGLLQ